jgi:hypothetical protein
MNITDTILRPKSILQIMMRILIIFVFFISILPFDKPGVGAQEPDKPQTVYLPLVFKNSTVSCPEGPDQWLCLLNYYRATTGVNLVTQNSTYNSTIALHTNYMLLNPTQENMHTEYAGNPGYSEAGKTAAGQSNMIKLIGATYLTQKQSIDLWMATPNHRYNMLHPDLNQSGFDLSCNSKNCFSGLNILGSLPPSYQIQNVNLVYPADKQQGIPVKSYPITWGFYMPWTGDETDYDEVKYVSGKIVDQDNNSISFSVSEPDRSDGAWTYNNQVALTPKSDLMPGKIYYVDLTVSYQGRNYSKSWSFTTAP